MDSIALDLGFIHIYWYSIFLLLGITAAILIINKELKNRNYSENFKVDLIFNMILFGIIGARIYYVIFNLSHYISNPIEIFQIWNGGLAIHGGLLFGFISVCYTCKKNKVKLLEVLDILVVGLIIGQAIGRWGNFFNSEAYGTITTVQHLRSIGIPNFIIDGMYILGEYRQPTFFYEFIFNLIGFAILLIYRWYLRKKKSINNGKLFGLYLVWYSVVRFFIEGIRTDSLMFGPLKMAQLVSIVLCLVGIYFLFLKNKKSKTI